MRTYVGLDAHAESCTLCSMRDGGRRPRETVLPTNGRVLVDWIRDLPGSVHVCLEESEWAAWLWEVIHPHVSEVVVVRGERRKGHKSDAVDARELADRLRTDRIGEPIFKAPREYAKLRELARVYWAVSRDLTRSKNRFKSAFRRRGLACDGTGFYAPTAREKLLRRLPASMRGAVAVLGEQVDYLAEVKAEAETSMVSESQRHGISRILETVPGLGPVRVAQLLPIVITPDRFRTRQQFWSYCGFAIVTQSSSDWVQGEDGKWVRGRVPQPWGLTRNFNRQLKAIFKGAATTVLNPRTGTSRFRHNYERLCDQGTKPNLAKLTVSRQLASTTLAMWKRKETYDPMR